jgi:hypothetical protein
MAQTAPILDIGLLYDRPKVRIDGRLYEMRTSDEFTYLTFRQKQRTFQRLGELLRKKRASAAEEKEQVRLLDLFVRELMVDVPDKLHARIRDSHRLEIIKAFFSQRQPTTRRAAEPNHNGHTAPSGRK